MVDKPAEKISGAFDHRDRIDDIHSVDHIYVLRIFLCYEMKLFLFYEIKLFLCYVYSFQYFTFVIVITKQSEIMILA